MPNDNQPKPVNMLDVQELYDKIKNSKDYKYLVVVVHTPAAPAPEYIINPIENFEGKMQYYMNAYDQEGRLKANPEVRILGIGFAQYPDTALSYAESFN